MFDSIQSTSKNETQSIETSTAEMKPEITEKQEFQDPKASKLLAPLEVVGLTKFRTKFEAKDFSTEFTLKRVKLLQEALR